ncbi:hypothetical protein PS467_20590 [Streptomyces luomodiensis]|uniref:Secreted protein n=1 Tax=Streptomyces luomodiensis TaxID=3026192 RepID=A0ABY9UZ34_9ACTN|nr:hypothetical protein [Streptomyces sp. SCA4-21]WNE97556.1 hypothetical protein PS467_20590 [Streptomyces sp. SCA4-21]
MRYAGSRTTGRRGTAIASSAAALCLGALLSGCGGGGDGYVAAGAAGPDGRRATTAVPPKGGVDLVPLDEEGTGNDRDGKGGANGQPGKGAAAPDATGDGRTDGPASQAPSASTEARGRTDGGSDGSGGADGGTSGSGAPGRPDDGPEGEAGPGEPSPSGAGASGSSGSPAPTGPAVLEVGEPERTATDERWCEKVKVEFRNTGGTPVTSGTVTFGTHVIDILGIDWATLESEEELPAPIGAGQKKEKTWTVCVDDWRVPLGMHIETQDVSVTWKP